MNFKHAIEEVSTGLCSTYLSTFTLEYAPSGWSMSTYKIWHNYNVPISYMQTHQSDEKAHALIGAYQVPKSSWVHHHKLLLASEDTVDVVHWISVDNRFSAPTTEPHDLRCIWEYTRLKVLKDLGQGWVSCRWSNLFFPRKLSIDYTHSINDYISVDLFTLQSSWENDIWSGKDKDPLEESMTNMTTKKRWDCDNIAI